MTIEWMRHFGGGGRRSIFGKITVGNSISFPINKESERSESVISSVVFDSLPQHGLQPARLLCPQDSQQECWSGLPFPSAGDLPNPGMDPRSPALQADSLLAEAPGKPTYKFVKCENPWPSAGVFPLNRRQSRAHCLQGGGVRLRVCWLLFGRTQLPRTDWLLVVSVPRAPPSTGPACWKEQTWKLPAEMPLQNRI